MSDCSSIAPKSLDASPDPPTSGQAPKGVLVPLTDHVALVSLTREIPTRSVLQVAAAIQKQVTRDFTPFWGLPATVDAFEDLASVPNDYHPVVIFGDLDELERAARVRDRASSRGRADRRVRARQLSRAPPERVHPSAVRARRGDGRLERRR